MDFSFNCIELSNLLYSRLIKHKYIKNIVSNENEEEEKDQCVKENKLLVDVRKYLLSWCRVTWVLYNVSFRKLK